MVIFDPDSRDPWDVNHHISPAPFGTIFLNVFPSIFSKQIQTSGPQVMLKEVQDGPLPVTSRVITPISRVK